MDFWIKAAQLICSLSLLVVLHEFGHYIPAKLFKTRVEKFYLFFDPWFSLVKKKVGETTWGIGWLPLGGYVKIAGMVDESMDTEQLAKPAEPWEFRSKPAWQRLIIMIGGVVVNLILGIFIFICIVFAWGEEQIPTKNLQAGLAVHPYLKKYNIQSGDNILSVNGETMMHFNDINNRIMLRGGRTLNVKHQNGQTETILLPETIGSELFQAGAFPAVGLRHKSTIIDSISVGSNADKAGLKSEDKLLEINGKPINFYDDIANALYDVKGKKTTVVIQRANTKDTIDVLVTPEGTLGFYAKTGKFIDEKVAQQKYYSFGESISRGISKGYYTLADYAAQFKFVFTKKGASSIGGFAAIGNMFPPVWDWHAFWATTALLSIILAFMNILPIPALDGGHVIFLLYEIITGKEAPQKVLEYAQYIGFILLLSLVVYANGNDIFRWLTA